GRQRLPRRRPPVQLLAEVALAQSVRRPQSHCRLMGGSPGHLPLLGPPRLRTKALLRRPSQRQPLTPTPSIPAPFSPPATRLRFATARSAPACISSLGSSSDTASPTPLTPPRSPGSRPRTVTSGTAAAAPRRSRTPASATRPSRVP